LDHRYVTMNKSPSRFKELLEQAIYQIRTVSGRPIGVIEDELGFALDRNGADFIRYLRKGNIPANQQDVEQLVEELVNEQGLDEVSCQSFLASAGHPTAKEMTANLFQGNHPQHDDALQPQSLKPFVVGPPIRHPQQFFGRTREMRRIFQALQPQFEHVAVIGNRRIGKTSLLQHLPQIATADAQNLRANQRADWLPNAEKYRWIYVDFQRTLMRKREGLLQFLAAQFNLPPQNEWSLDLFVEALIDHGLSRPTVLMLDELGAGLTASEFDQSFWWGIRSILNDMTSANLAILVAAHDDPAKLATDQGKASPFFNVFNSIQLGPFTEDEARGLIDSSTVPFAEEDIIWILEQSEQLPHRIQILCQARLSALEDDEKGEAWKEWGMSQISW